MPISPFGNRTLKVPSSLSGCRRSLPLHNDAKRVEQVRDGPVEEFQQKGCSRKEKMGEPLKEDATRQSSFSV